MDPAYIEQLQKLIEGLYSTTEPNFAREIQEQLQNFQRQPQAWEIASQLLDSPSDQCRFFGAHTFQVKIARDWATLPEERIECLRRELMTWIVKLSSGPLFIITKLCTALITYAFHTVPEKWQQFISDTVITLQSGSQAYGIPPSVINTTILEFLTLVPEEISNASILGGKRPQILQELKDGIPVTLSTLSAFIVTSGQENDVSNQEKALKCLQSWVQYGIDLEQCYTLIQQTILSLTREDLFSAAADVLLESMQQTAWTKYNSLRNDLLNCFASDWMKEKLTESIQDEDEETARTLAKLLTTFGETYTDFMASELADTKLTLILDMILQLTAFPGHFPADQEVSELPLNFWYVFQETLFDNGIVPLRPSAGIAIVTENDDERRSTDQTTAAQRQMWLRQCGEIALARYRQLVTILRNKAAFPEEAVWNSWTKDVRDKFRTSRRDLGDTLMNPYYLLQSEMLAILLDQAVAILNQWNYIPLASQELEATLFCLKSISEEIPAEENTQIPRFFGPEVLSRMPPDCGLRLQNTTLLLIGSLSEWLKLHSDFLPAVMNYIVPCLSTPKLSACAASAFSDICDTCRQFLVGDLDSMMHVYGAMASSMIEPSTMQKVVESVADVIQVLPAERSAAPLMVLVGDILKGLRNALNNSMEDANGAREAVLVQLQYLSACCRGIQSPADDYQSLTARHDTYDSFASGDSLAFYRNVDGFDGFTAAIRDVTQQIAVMWDKDEQLMKALSQFIEAGIRSTSPLLTLTFDNLISIVCSAYQSCPFACWLHTAAFIVTVYGGQSAEHAKLRDMLANLTGKTFSLVGNSAAMEEHPDVVFSYFDLLSRTIQRCPEVFYQLSPETIENIFMFAVAGMGLQERLALQAALNFMADFVTQDIKEGSQQWDITQALLVGMGPKILEQLLAGIGGRVPRSFAGLLVDVLYKMTCRYVEPCKYWLQELLARDGFPSNLVTAEDKAIFMKGILGTRSLKKFKQYAHEFSIKCRGLDKTTY